MGGVEVRRGGGGVEGGKGWFLTIFERCSVSLPILEQTKLCLYIMRCQAMSKGHDGFFY